MVEEQTLGLEIPEGADAVTADWLTAALSAGGSLPAGRVRSVRTRVVGEGVGIVASLARFELDLEGAPPGTPHRVIGKFASRAAENREVARFFQFYEREVRFYQELAPSLPERPSMRVPRCYYSAFDPESQRFALLLEDFGDLRPGDQLAGCSGATLERAIGELAALHASYWNDPALDDFAWLPRPTDPIYMVGVPMGYQAAWPVFVERFGELLSDPLRTAGERYPDLLPRIIEPLSSQPLTLVHGDYRLDNMFFETGPDRDDRALALIDFQIVAHARGVFDLAYFVSGNVPNEERRGRERDIVAEYHQRLVEGGVRDYSVERCWEDYRRSLLYYFVYPVIGGAQLDVANDRGQALQWAIAERAVTAIEDLAALDLLPT